MDVGKEYTGTHKVILPPDYLNSIDAVCELYEDRITEAGASLDIPGLQLSAGQRAFRWTLAAVAIWLIPAVWLTCL